jgi:hypothetical protein
MRTPAGKECDYYYEDFHRRSVQECRLLKHAPGPKWRTSDCEHCPVPNILWANASEDLVLEGEIKVGLLGIGRRVAVSAWCRKHSLAIDDPYVGCEICASERPSFTDFLEGHQE